MEYPLVVKRAGGVGVSVFTTRVGNCKGYYCGHLGLPSEQPPDAPRMVAGHVPEARARSI